MLLINLLLVGCSTTEDVIVSRPFSESYTVKESKVHELGRVIPVENYRITLNATNMFYVHKRDHGKDKRGLGSDYYWDMKRADWIPRNRDVFFIEFIIPTRSQDIRLTPNAFSLLLNQQKYIGVLYKATKPSSVFEGELCDFYVRDKQGDIIWRHPNEFNPDESLKLVNPMVLAANQEYCFAIKFDTPPPMPENEFTLIFGGLGKEVIQVPFKYAEYQEWHN